MKSSLFIVITGLALFVLVPVASSSYASAPCSHENSGENFRSFFSRYSSDRSFAISRTIYPYIDITDTSELETIRTLVTREKEKHHHSLQEYAKLNGMKLKVTRVGKSTAEGRVFSPGAGFFVEFKFRQKNGCWYMYSTYTYSF